jgi:YafQ family addiction module toxin component
MYALEVPEHLDKKFLKLAKKDRQQKEAIERKVTEILADPHRGKPLRGDMKGARRVHIQKSFVLIYEIDEQNQIVRLLDYEHHDRAYEIR